MQLTSPVARPSIDRGALLSVTARPLIAWAALLALAAYQGYGSTALATPLAWVMALPVGWNYMAVALRGQPRPALAGAALAGALLGLGLGVIFAVGVGLGIKVEPDELGQMRAISLGVAVVGTVVCSALALLFGWLARRRAGATR